MSTPVHVPLEVGVFWADLALHATQICTANHHVFIADIRDPMPVYRDLCLTRVEFVQDDTAVFDTPGLHLLLSDS